jgi:hypothetical protein
MAQGGCIAMIVMSVPLFFYFLLLNMLLVLPLDLSKEAFAQDIDASEEPIAPSEKVPKIPLNPPTTSSPPQDENPGDFSPLTSMALAREIISASESKLIYDWRRSRFEASLGYGYTDEANSFNAEALDLGLGIPLGNGLRVSGGLRRILVYGTPSTNLLGRTPYLQESTMTRLELYGGIGLSLLEGRAISILSTWIGDLEQSLFGVVQIHWAQEQENLNPFARQKPKQKLGQKPVSSPLAFELGLRMNVYTTFNYGLYLEWLHVRPLNSGEYLVSWNQFAGGLLWSLP